MFRNICEPQLAQRLDGSLIINMLTVHESEGQSFGFGLSFLVVDDFVERERDTERSWVQTLHSRLGTSKLRFVERERDTKEVMGSKPTF